MDLGLKGKYALVTGGSHGIGYYTALALASEGCHVAVCARGNERIARAVRAIEERGVQAIGICGDAMVKEDIDRAVEEIARTWGTLHILVNNVGGGGRWGSRSVEETAEQVWLEVYSKNALAAIRFTMSVLPYMRRQKWGRIVTVASIFGREGGGRPWFNMAKSAEISLMKSLALDRELVRDGITFNTVAPGGIMIPETGWEIESKKNPDEFAKMVDLEYPLGRMGTPEEVANVIVFVCSEKASLLNGACIAADGGQSRSF